MAEKPELKFEATAPPGSDAAGKAPAGQWPVEAHKSGVIITGMLWALWFVFLVWMMIQRINATPV